MSYDNNPNVLPTIEYKGYRASVVFADGNLNIVVEGIDDLLAAVTNRAASVPHMFHQLIEDYLRDCVELERDPTPPRFDPAFKIRGKQIAELRRLLVDTMVQVRMNVEHAKQHAPEGPIVDGKRTPGVTHSQEILAGHVIDHLVKIGDLLNDIDRAGVKL